MPEPFGVGFEPTEARVARLVDAHAESAVRPFDPAAIAHAVASGARSRPSGWTRRAPAGRLIEWPTPMRLGLLLLVLAALTILVIMSLGGRHDRKLGSGPPGNGLIAFDAGGDILVADADGHNQRTLIGGPTLDWRPTFSRDGTRMAYWSTTLDPVQSDCPAPLDQMALYRDQPVQTLCQFDPDLVVLDLGTGTRTVVATKVPQPNVISWSPDGGRIAYGAGVGVGIAESTRSGTAAVVVPGVDASDPAWSPDGMRLAFHFRDDGGPGVFVAAPDGTGRQRLTHQASGPNGAPDFRPAWSPDGTRIAFLAGEDGGYALWTVNADATGSDEHEIETFNDSSLANDLWDSWSPDGSRLLYLKGDFPDCCDAYIRAVTADGKSDTAVSTLSFGYGAPVWSPDGTRLLGIGKSTETQSNDKVFIVDPSDPLDPITLQAEGIGFLDWQPVWPNP